MNGITCVGDRIGDITCVDDTISGIICAGDDKMDDIGCEIH